MKVLCHRKNSPSVHFYYHTEVYKLPYERAWWAGGGGELVHEIPPALVLPFPLHQVPRVSSLAAGADLVHEIPPALISPFPLHQVPRFFSLVAGRRLGARKTAGPCSSVPFAPSPPRFFARGRAPTWCTKFRRPLFLRFLCTKSRAFLRPWPGGRGASPPARPCFFVLRHHVLEHSSRSRRTGVVPHRPLDLVSSSWGTTSPSTAAVPAGRAWCLTAR